MSPVSTKPPSGMRDFLPHEIRRRRHVLRVIERIYESYGFQPLETPSIENLSTLLGKYGDEGDQLLYRILHRRDALRRALERDEIAESDLADLGLRYDLTVPLARVVAQYGDLPRFFKRYQIQPVWRADRPGRGRFREFYQCDVDVTGTESLLAEVDVCAAVSEVLGELGFDDFTICLNHRVVLREAIRTSGLESDQEETALVAIDKLDKIGDDGVLEELRRRGVPEAAGSALLALLTCDDKDSNEETLGRLAAALDDEAAAAALDDISRLLEASQDTAAGGHLRVTPTLARGLGYYTGPIFEISVADLAGSMGGGGRYDGLVGMFGKRQIPAVGFSLGLERILLVLEERGLYPDLPGGPDLFLCQAGVPLRDVARVASVLRAGGLRIDVYPEANRKLGKQLQYAASGSVGALGVAILGSDELADGSITLKNLASGEQSRVPLEQAGDQVRAWRQ